jgi:hypothetical protein
MGILKIIILFILVFYYVVPLRAQTCPPYEWPAELEGLIDLSEKMRLKILAQEMEKFSKQVGHCYNRPGVGKAEETWVKGKRVEKIREIMASKNVKEFCAEVRENLIDEKLPNPFWNKSPFNQYANCGEGSMVGACLAYHYGYSADEIKVCISKNDHAWTLIPEKGTKDSYCLLDRWNSFRCNVKLIGKEHNSSWKGNVKVPGKTAFKFNDATCTTLTQKFGN